MMFKENMMTPISIKRDENDGSNADFIHGRFLYDGARMDLSSTHHFRISVALGGGAQMFIRCPIADIHLQ